MKPLVPVYLSLGSNISPDENIRAAVRLLIERTDVIAISNVWETSAVGTPGPNFFNAAVGIHTSLSAGEVKSDLLRGIEQTLARVRSADKFAPRTIDLDIVIFADQCLEPRLWSLAYLAVPMAEIYPDYHEAETGRSLADVARELAKETIVIQRPEVLSAIRR